MGGGKAIPKSRNTTQPHAHRSHFIEGRQSDKLNTLLFCFIILFHCSPFWAAAIAAMITVKHTLPRGSCHVHVCTLEVAHGGNMEHRVLIYQELIPQARVDVRSWFIESMMVSPA